MSIERFVTTANRPSHAKVDRATCLDCAACVGTGWSLSELIHLPDTILHNRGTARA